MAAGAHNTAGRNPERHTTLARDQTLCFLPARAEKVDDGSRVKLEQISLTCRLEIRRIASQVREPVARD